MSTSSPLTPAQRRQRAQLAVHESWARTRDRAARTAPAREARRQRYLDRAAEIHPGAPAEVVERAAESLRRADLYRMALAASRARQAKRQGNAA